MLLLFKKPTTTDASIKVRTTESPFRKWAIQTKLGSDVILFIHSLSHRFLRKWQLLQNYCLRGRLQRVKNMYNFFKKGHANQTNLFKRIPLLSICTNLGGGCG